MPYSRAKESWEPTKIQRGCLRIFFKQWNLYWNWHFLMIFLWKTYLLAFIASVDFNWIKFLSLKTEKIIKCFYWFDNDAFISMWENQSESFYYINEFRKFKSYFAINNNEQLQHKIIDWFISEHIDFKPEKINRVYFP